MMNDASVVVVIVVCGYHIRSTNSLIALSLSSSIQLLPKRFMVRPLHLHTHTFASALGERTAVPTWTAFPDCGILYGPLVLLWFVAACSSRECFHSSCSYPFHRSCHRVGNQQTRTIPRLTPVQNQPNPTAHTIGSEHHSCLLPLVGVVNTNGSSCRLVISPTAVSPHE